MRRSRVPAFVLLALLATGCAEDGSASDEPTVTPTGTASGDATSGGLVAGSGAGISPEDPEAWCGAVTAEQLTEATGFQVDAVIQSRTMSGHLSCLADVPGVEIQVRWTVEETKQTAEKYLASWKKPAGAFDVQPVQLGSGAAGASATAESPVQARVGVIHHGVLVQAELSVILPGADVPTSAELAALGEELVAVYAG